MALVGLDRVSSTVRLTFVSRSFTTGTVKDLMVSPARKSSVPVTLVKWTPFVAVPLAVA